jgi:hypothetical protein
VWEGMGAIFTKILQSAILDGVYIAPYDEPRCNVDAMKSSGFKSRNLSNEMNLINSNNLTHATNTAIFYSMC